MCKELSISDVLAGEYTVVSSRRGLIDRLISQGQNGIDFVVHNGEYIAVGLIGAGTIVLSVSLFKVSIIIGLLVRLFGVYAINDCITGIIRGRK